MREPGGLSVQEALIRLEVLQIFVQNLHRKTLGHLRRDKGGPSWALYSRVAGNSCLMTPTIWYTTCICGFMRLDLGYTSCQAGALVIVLHQSLRRLLYHDVLRTSML